MSTSGRKAIEKTKRSPTQKNNPTSKRAAIEKALDTVTARIVKLRDDYRCQRTGAILDKYEAEWCHIEGRGNRMLRWHPWNAITMKKSVHAASHRYPDIFKAWFAYTFPRRSEFIESCLRKSPQPIRTYKMEELLESHKSLLAALEASEPVDRMKLVDNYCERMVV